MNVTVLFWIIIAIIVVDYVLECVLDYLNGTRRGAPVPSELADLYDAETYEKQQRYEQAKSRIGFWSSTAGFILIMVMFFAVYTDCWIIGLQDLWKIRYLPVCFSLESCSGLPTFFLLRLNGTIHLLLKKNSASTK